LAVWALVGTILGFAGGARAQVPTVDIQNTCRITATAMVQMMGTRTTNDQEAFKQCMNGEDAALAQIRKDWNTFQPRDKSICIQPQSYMPSYVEWLTCLEMERDLRKMRAERGEREPDLRDPVTLPVVILKPLW
jgi:hypothetical protein